ncbi:dynein regulatory complex protein 9 [Bradysia coprophila]|uniref:dynein regulatory complex protein 9 n=1 Tax=Bradysia coprophila TaxID=38358 RepID=UPI00187DA46C|nr:dynein regulatory complex protein 9 [Bradysia coprophila]
MSNRFHHSSFHDRYKNYLRNSINCSMDIVSLTFSKVQSQIIAAIATELTEVLLILNHGKENFYRIPQHVTMPERYRYEYRDKQFDDQTLEPMEKALRRMTSVKLENEIELLRLVLIDLIDELHTSMSFTHLQTKINEFLRDARTEYDFIREFISNDNRVAELKLQLKQSKDSGEKMLKELNDEIMDVESRIYDIQIQNELKFCLVSKWENTRHQQANIILSKEVTKLMDSTNEYKVKIDREQLAINDIRNFLNFQIDDLSTQIDQWMERYVKEVQELDTEIGQVKDAIQDVKSKNEDITGRYDMRQSDIDEYREEQRILEEKRKFEEKQCNSAIRIQSWWRGVMVRMELGPYRPKKKNKKGGKKK